MFPVLLLCNEVLLHRTSSYHIYNLQHEIWKKVSWTVWISESEFYLCFFQQYTEPAKRRWLTIASQIENGRRNGSTSIMYASVWWLYVKCPTTIFVTARPPQKRGCLQVTSNLPRIGDIFWKTTMSFWLSVLVLVLNHLRLHCQSAPGRQNHVQKTYFRDSCWNRAPDGAQGQAESSSSWGEQLRQELQSWREPARPGRPPN